MSCLICGLSLDDFKTCTVRSKGLETLVQCSLDRNDNLHETFCNVETIRLHDTCRCKYTHRKFNGKLACVNVYPPNCGPKVSFEYVPTISENCTLNTSVSIPAVETPPERSIVITAAPVDNKNYFIINTNFVSELGDTNSTQSHSEVPHDDMTSDTDGYHPESNYGHDTDIEMKYLTSREEPSSETSCSHTNLDDNNFNNTVACKKSEKHGPLYNNDTAKQFNFYKHCFLCSKNLFNIKKELFFTLTNTRLEKIMFLLKKCVFKNIRVLERIDGVDLLQAKARIHRKCLSALYNQRNTTRKRGGLPCPLLKSAFEKICRYMEDTDRTEFTSDELTNASLHGEEYQPLWSSVKKRLEAKYDGKIYFSRGKSCVVVTLIKDSTMVIEPLGSNNTGLEEIIDAQKKKQIDTDVKKEIEEDSFEATEKSFDKEMIAENNDTFNLEETEVDIFEDDYNIDDDNAEDETENEDNKWQMKENDIDVTDEDTTSSNVKKPCAAFNEKEIPIEKNDKTITRKMSTESELNSTIDLITETEFNATKCDINHADLEVNNGKGKSAEKKYFSNNKHITIENKLSGEQKPIDKDIDTKECSEQSPKFSFQTNCLFCGNIIKDQSKLPPSKRQAVSRVLKVNTQDTIIRLLRSKPIPKNIEALKRIKGVDLLQVKARYHVKCYCLLLVQKGVHEKRGRPECPLLTEAMEKIYKHIDESDRTEFTSAELTSKTLLGDYRPTYATVERKMLQKYAGKMYLTKVPWQRTIVTVIKDSGSGGGTTVPPWNLNNTDFGEQHKERRCFKKNVLVEAETKTNKVSKHNKNIITDEDNNDDLINDTHDSDEYTEDGKIESNLLSFCQICLSSNRRLEDISKYTDIFSKLCPDLMQDFEPKKFLICWECTARLKTIHNFQKKVMIAQKFWNTQVQVLPKPLSTLSIDTPSTANISCIDEKQKSEDQFDQKVVTLDITPQKDIPILEESKPALEDINIEYDTFDDTNFNDDSEEEEKPRSKLKRRKAKDNEKTWIDSDTESEESTIKSNSAKKRKCLNVDLDWTEEKEKEINKKRTEKPQEVKNKKVKLKVAYTVIVQTYITESKMKRERIQPHKLQYWLEAERNSEYFKTLKQKCSKCLSEVSHNHNDTSHSAENPFVCDICESTFARNDEKESHVASHYYVFSCEFCGYKCYNETHMRGHVETHRKLVQCLECFAAFETFDTLKEHFNHLHRYAECDYCGKHFFHKRAVATHIERYHMPQICTICNKLYKNYFLKSSHMNLKHRIERTEAAYCVQCDIQFDNVGQLKRHIYKNKSHRHEWNRKPKGNVKEQHKCPECPNVYARKETLKNHFTLVHEKKINFYCKDCDKAFQQKSSYEWHMKKVHQGIKPPKNKFCDICGQGFATNRILIHHIRTHTGERPHACPHCAARFAQKTAMNTHIRNVHEQRPKDKAGDTLHLL